MDKTENFGNLDEVIRGSSRPRCCDLNGNTPLISSKETGIGAFRPDPNSDRPTTPGTMPLIGRLLPIDVNPGVNPTTGKMHADKPPSARR